MNIFQPIASLIKAKNTQELFENQLLYFTPAEEQMMVQIGERLEYQHQVLLLGNPATGKSMMAFATATQLKAKGYQAYYCSLASSDKGLWDDINALLYHKVLFIIDDCHLDVDAATELGFKFHALPNVTATLLFISRNISKKLQKSEQFEWFNLFEELKEATFQTESHHLDTKVSGIIAKYQAYYQRQTNDCQYEIGDEAVIVRNIRKSLVTLSYYLALWKEIPVLSDISETQVLEKVYEEYFLKLALNQQQIACLLQYACLYTFEIEFESLPDYKETTELLAEKGIILETRKHIYSFYHRDFADLLLRAAYEERRFQRKYKTFDNFLLVQIKSYLLSFVADYGYPNNVHAILSNIAGSQKALLLEELVADDDLKKLIVAFYAEETDRLTLLHCVNVLSRNAPILFKEYFKNLFDKNKYFKQVFFLAKDSFDIYVSILNKLQKSEIAYNAFLASWEKQEPALIKHAEIQHIGHGLRLLQLHISQDKAKRLYNRFDNAFFIPKIAEANLANIGRALNELNKVNHDKTAAIFAQFDNAFFIPKIKEANLANIGEALNRLNQVNPSKVAAILAQFDNAFFIPLIAEVNLANIGRALNELNQVSFSKATTILAQFDNAFFIPKIAEANLANIGEALNKLHKINPSKAAAILAQIDNASLIPKITDANLTNIGKTLIELNQVNPRKTAAIFAQIDNAFFIPKIAETNLANIGEALNRLNKINPSKAAAIFENIDDNLLIQKATPLNFARLANLLFQLDKVSANKTLVFFKTLQSIFTVDILTKEIETIKYETFLSQFPIFPKLDVKFGKALLQNIDESYLFQWNKLKNLRTVNQLQNAFSLVKVSNKNLKQLISNSFS